MQPPVAYGTAKQIKRTVFFTGSTAIKRGQGLCFDRDYGTAADHDENRDYKVEAPSASNNLNFAGVAAKNYNARTGGQMVEIYEPGSVCDVLVGVDTVVNTTIMTCSATATDAGRFTLKGFLGRGSAIALQTETDGQVDDGFAGTAAVAVSAGVSTVTLTGIGTASSAGDRLVVVGGTATAGVYTIASAPTADTITITGDLGNSTVATCYVIPANEVTVLAYLFDGEESGLQQIITPADDDASAAMVGGTTFVAGGVTIGTGDSTDTLADGTREGLKKAFCGLGTVTTNDHLVTVTSGLQSDGSTALASAAIDAANEFISLEWTGSFGANTGGLWIEKASTATKSAT